MLQLRQSHQQITLSTQDMPRSMMMIAHENSSAYAPFFNPSRYSQRSKAVSSACSASPAVPAPAAYGHATDQRKKGRQPAPANSAAGLPVLPVLRQLFQLALQVIA
jgi:hypothetical protein